MGYRSNIRIRLTTKDFKELTKQYNEKFKKENNIHDLFDNFDIKRAEANDVYDIITGTYKKVKVVYFGWDYLKWYEDFEDVKFIENFVKATHNYSFARIGEALEDFESQFENLDEICVSNYFYDDKNKLEELKNNIQKLCKDREFYHKPHLTALLTAYCLIENISPDEAKWDNIITYLWSNLNTKTLIKQYKNKENFDLELSEHLA